MTASLVFNESHIEFQHGTRLPYRCQSGYQYDDSVTNIPNLVCMNGVWSGGHKCTGIMFVLVAYKTYIQLHINCIEHKCMGMYGDYSACECRLYTDIHMHCNTIIIKLFSKVGTVTDDMILCVTLFGRGCIDCS